MPENSMPLLHNQLQVHRHLITFNYCCAHQPLSARSVFLRPSPLSLPADRFSQDVRQLNLCFPPLDPPQGIVGLMSVFWPVVVRDQCYGDSDDFKIINLRINGYIAEPRPHIDHVSNE